MKFIYVCTPADRDTLMKLGFELISNHKETSLWVFANNENILEDVGEVIDVFTYSNTLMF